MSCYLGSQIRVVVAQDGEEDLAQQTIIVPQTGKEVGAPWHANGRKVLANPKARHC